MPAQVRGLDRGQMTGWAALALAIVGEVLGTSALKASDGMARPGPAVLAVLGYGVALYCLSVALQRIPLGVAYAVWSGLGLMAISAVGRAVYGQRLDAAALVGMGLIVAGVVVVHVFSDSQTGTVMDRKVVGGGDEIRTHDTP